MNIFTSYLLLMISTVAIAMSLVYASIAVEMDKSANQCVAELIAGGTARNLIIKDGATCYVQGTIKDKE